MTNYNERLDEALFEAIESAATYTHNVTAEEADHIQERAKQAITSLIKELVAEAKPEVPEEYERDDALFIGFERGTEYYYDAISNLLKALEEVE